MEVEGGEALVALVGGVESGHFVFDVLQVGSLRAFVVCLAMLKPESVLTEMSEVKKGSALSKRRVRVCLHRTGNAALFISVTWTIRVTASCPHVAVSSFIDW